MIKISKNNYKFITVALLLVGLLTLVGCSDDDGGSSVKTYNVSGQVVDSSGDPVAGVLLKADDAGTAETGQNGEWSFTGVEEGTNITPVFETEIQSGVEFKPAQIEVNEDKNDYKILAQNVNGGYQGSYPAQIDYDKVAAKTEIRIEFDGDVRPVDETTPLKERITVTGTDKEFTVNLVESEDDNDGDDQEGDYLEDKVLLIRISGRIAGELAAKIEGDTLIKYDADGEARKKVRAIETEAVALSSNTNLTEAVSNPEVINTVKNQEQVVVVNWILNNKRMPQVRELFAELKTEDSEAKIINIADRIEEDLNHIVTEDDLIVVRAEDGTTTQYKIQLAYKYKDATVVSKLDGTGNARYTVNDSPAEITSGSLGLVWDTTVGQFETNIKLSADELLTKVADMKVVAVDANIADNTFESLTALNTSKNLGQGNDNNVAAKLVVRAVNGSTKVYDIITEEPRKTTKVAAVEDETEESMDDDVSYKVLEVDNGADIVYLRSDLKGTAYGDLLTGLEGAEISEITTNEFLVTAEDGETTTRFEVKYAPGYEPRAYVDDRAPYILTVKFGELDESIEDDADYLDLEQDILDDFTVTVGGNSAQVVDVDLVDDQVAGTDNDTSDKAYLRLDTKVLEGQEVTVAYQPDSSEDPYFISPSGVRTVGFATQIAKNNVDAPNYSRVVREVNDGQAGTVDNKITVEFDDQITAVGDTTVIAEDFTVQTTKDRDGKLISGAQNPDVTDVAVINSNRVELTLDSRILATEKIEVYYEPDYTADNDVLADTDTVESNALDLSYCQSGLTGLDFIDYDKLVSESVKGENVVRLFAEGEGTDSTTGKSVPSNVEVPSIERAYIPDGEADNIYLGFTGAVNLNVGAIVDVNNWFTIADDRELVGITQEENDLIKLELDEGVNEAAGDIDVTYEPQLRSDNVVPATFLTDTNSNKILRNKITAENQVESASFFTAYVDDNDGNEDVGQQGSTAEKVIVEFDEKVTITDKTGLKVTVDGKTAKINDVSTSGDVLTITLDTKVQAEQNVSVSYEAERTTNNLLDAIEIDRTANNTEENVDVVSFSNNEVSNNVEAPEFASGLVNDGERNAVYIKATELLEYTNSPDFNFTANYEDEFADDNFTVIVNGQENRVTNSELINDSATDETVSPQIKLSLTNELVDDDQDIKLSYQADDNTREMLHDSQDNPLQDFSSKQLDNNLKTPDFHKAKVIDSDPNVLSLTIDSADSLDSATVTNDSSVITINNSEVTVNNTTITGSAPNRVVKYELATPVETGTDSLTVDLGATTIKDSDGDRVSQLDSPITATNGVAGPEIKEENGAVIKDNASNEVVVSFDESLANDGESGLPGMHTTNLANLEDDFTVTVKGQTNSVTKVETGTANNQLVLTLENKVAAGIEDVNLEYRASQDLADQYGNKTTKDFTGAVTNNVANDTKVDHDATNETSSSTTITVEMTDTVAIDGEATNLELDVIDGNSNELSVKNVVTSGSTVTVTLSNELSANQGNLTVCYEPTIQDNLVGANTDTDPVAIFTAHIENTL